MLQAGQSQLTLMQCWRATLTGRQGLTHTTCCSHTKPPLSPQTLTRKRLVQHNEFWACCAATLILPALGAAKSARPYARALHTWLTTKHDTSFLGHIFSCLFGGRADQQCCWGRQSIQLNHNAVGHERPQKKICTNNFMQSTHDAGWSVKRRRPPKQQQQQHDAADGPQAGEGEAVCTCSRWQHLPPSVHTETTRDQPHRRLLYNNDKHF